MFLYTFLNVSNFEHIGTIKNLFLEYHFVGKLRFNSVYQLKITSVLDYNIYTSH